MGRTKGPSMRTGSPDGGVVVGGAEVADDVDAADEGDAPVDHRFAVQAAQAVAAQRKLGHFAAVDQHVDAGFARSSISVATNSRPPRIHHQAHRDAPGNSGAAQGGGDAVPVSSFAKMWSRKISASAASMAACRTGKSRRRFPEGQRIAAQRVTLMDSRRLQLGRERGVVGDAAPGRAAVDFGFVDVEPARRCDRGAAPAKVLGKLRAGRPRAEVLHARRVVRWGCRRRGCASR